LLAARRRGGRALSDPVAQAFTVALEETDGLSGREADCIAIAYAQDGIVTEARTNSQALTDAEALRNTQAFVNADAISKTVVDPETFSDSQTFAVGEAGC
jgi:hypothetical protein